MTLEAQILLRSNSPEQLADDIRAVSEFIEQRRRRASPLRETPSVRQHLRVVEDQRRA